MIENVSLIPDRSKMRLLNLPQNASDVYWINGVLKTGEPPINQLPDGVTLSYQTKNGREGEANFRVTVSRIYADGDYFGKKAEAYEDIYESSDENAKLLRTKKQVVSSYYGGGRYKQNSVMKDGKVVCRAFREDDGMGNVLYNDIHGKEKVYRYTYRAGVPYDAAFKRSMYSDGYVKGKIRNFLMRISNNKNGCERPYIRKIAGALFRCV